MKPGVLNNPFLTLRQGRHEQALSFDVWRKGTSERCTGKVPQRMNAEIRQMHRQLSGHSNPTCALRARCV